MKISREKFIERGPHDEAESLSIHNSPIQEDTSPCMVTKRLSVAEVSLSLPIAGQSLEVLVGLLKNRLSGKPRTQRDQNPAHADAHLRANLEQS